MKENSNKIGRNIEASLRPLKIVDPYTQRYKGYAFLNYLVLNKQDKRRMRYLNLLCKVRVKSRGRWEDIDEFNVRIPLPGIKKMVNFIDNHIPIHNTAANNKIWKFITK